MIEVEKKFVLTEDNLTKLTEGAKFIGEKNFTDNYYDTKDYRLALKDHWFRNRDGRWELKVPYNDLPKGKQVSDQYKEIEDEKEIALNLGLDPKMPLAESLESNGYRPFATITTYRKKYSKNGFAIDVDSASFGYEIIEIELMVESEGEMENATKRILEFAQSLGLSEGIVRGKISEYLYRFKRADHKLLLDAGVLSL